MRSTKIVATIGPASQSPDVLEEMVSAGMDVARLNFAHGTSEQAASLASFAAAAQAALAEGLGVNAGHDLNLANLGDFVAAVPGVLEVSIGHAFVADALELGMAAAVRAYVDALARSIPR